MPTKAKAPSSKPAAAPEIPLAEWIVGGIGFLLVAATIGYMLYAAMTKQEGPPDIQMEVLAITPLPQGCLVQFRAVNRGDQSASDLHIIGSHGEGAAAEESEAVVDFLPAQSERRGGLYFKRQPSADSLSLRASGYQEP